MQTGDMTATGRDAPESSPPAPQDGDENRKMPPRKGGRIYLIATVAQQFCALARYTIMARVLGPEQLGLAATLILTMQFFELMSDSGSDRFLIQNRAATDPRALRLIHYVAMSRGAMIFACLAVFSGPLSQFYNAPQLQYGLMVLGVVPFIFGFRHLDYRRLQRYNDFRAEGWVTLCGETLSLIGTAVATFILRDFTAILVGLSMRSITMVIVSHIVAERRYAVGFAREHAAAFRRFAMPLMANGLLIFFGMQSDRILIAQRVGIAELGQYSAVLLMIYYPLAIVQRLLVSTNFPHVAAAQGQLDRLNRAANAFAGKGILVGMVAMWGYALAGVTACTLLYGERFIQPYWLIGLIGIFQFVRFLRSWPVNMALGTGNSKIVLANNMVRLTAIPIAIVGEMWFDHMGAVVAAFAIGEFLALLTALLLVNVTLKRGTFRDFDRIAQILLACGVVVGLNLSHIYDSFTGGALAMVMGAGTAYWVVRRDLRLFSSMWQKVTRLPVIGKVLRRLG